MRVCQNPLLGGVAEAMKRERIAEIVARYEGMTQIFVLCVDRDGEAGRRRRLDHLQEEFGDGRVFVAENAWEELETWVLAGIDLPKGWRWADVRAANDVKERYFDVLARDRGVADGPGGGRKVLGKRQRIGFRGFAGGASRISIACPGGWKKLRRPECRKAVFTFARGYRNPTRVPSVPRARRRVNAAAACGPAHRLGCMATARGRCGR